MFERMLFIERLFSNVFYLLMEFMIGAAIIITILIILGQMDNLKKELDNPENQKKHKKYVRFNTILLIGGIAFITASIFIKVGLVDERDQFESEFYASLVNHTEVDVKDIVRSEEVSKFKCPLVELSETEKCYYIEFVSETGISEVFMPLDKTKYSNAQNVTIKYVELTEKQQAFLYEYLHVEKGDSVRHLKITQENFSLGVSLTKE